MAAQGGETDELGRLSCGEQLIESVESDIVTYTPLGGLLLSTAVVLLPNQLAETCTHQITTHIGEIDVTTIDISSMIALTLQRTRNARQPMSLLRHLHDR